VDVRAGAGQLELVVVLHADPQVDRVVVDGAEAADVAGPEALPRRRGAVPRPRAGGAGAGGEAAGQEQDRQQSHQAYPSSPCARRRASQLAASRASLRAIASASGSCFIERASAQAASSRPSAASWPSVWPLDGGWGEAGMVVSGRIVRPLKDLRA